MYQLGQIYGASTMFLTNAFIIIDSIQKEKDRATQLI